jgi:hypothetical protein
MRKANCAACVNGITSNPKALPYMYLKICVLHTDMYERIRLTYPISGIF